ncbi:unnamed protein product [Bathycoccus prasinos]
MSHQHHQRMSLRVANNNVSAPVPVDTTNTATNAENNEENTNQMTPNRDASHIQRRLSSGSGIINSAISMLKSIAKSASSAKRERAETMSSEEDVENNEFLQGEDANAKRAKRSLGTNTASTPLVNATSVKNDTTPPPTKKADADSSFITSSLRKSKKSKSEKEENGGGGRQLRFAAAGTTRRNTPRYRTTTWRLAGAPGKRGRMTWKRREPRRRDERQRRQRI